MQVFDHQPKPLQLSIVGKALSTPSPMGNMILQGLRGESPFNVNPSSLPQPVRMELPAAQVYTSLIARGVKVPGLSSNESPSLKAALAVIFKSQSPQRRAQIESNGQKLGIIPKDGGLLQSLGFVAHDVAGALGSGKSGDAQTFQTIAALNGVPGTPTDAGVKALGLLGGAFAQARHATTPGGGATAATIAGINGVPTAPDVALNAAKDAINLPETALSTAGQVGKDAIAENWGQLAKDFYGAPLSMIEHPKTILEHPLFAYLMATGAFHGASRLAVAPVRALAPDSALGRAVATDRPSVALSGKLTHEPADYSKYPGVKAMQKGADAVKYKTAPTGETVPRSTLIKDTKTSSAIGRLSGIAERIRRAGRAKVTLELHKALTPGDSAVARTAAKAATGVKTALLYGSRKALIPGASILARIADGTIRRPDTLVADLKKHLADVVANRGNLTSAGDIAAHQRYVKTLTDALHDEKFLRNPGPAFKAATVYAKLYKPLEGLAHKLGHYRDMAPDMLERRTHSHYAVAHLDANYDPQFETLMRHGSKAEVRSFVEKLRAESNRLERMQEQGGPIKPGDDRLAELLHRRRKAWEDQIVPLSNAEIRAHMEGPEGVGGRPLAFTSDKVVADQAKADRASRFVSGSQRVMPEGSKAKRNTLYAYTHGLTHPGHEGLVNRALYIRGVVDSLKHQNRLVDKLAIKPAEGWQKDPAVIEKYIRQNGLEKDLQPFNIATRPFFPQTSLEQGLKEGNVHPVDAQLEALRRGHDLTARLDTSVKGGDWGMVDKHAIKVLDTINKSISPDVLTRTLKGMNSWFRTVVLSTSAKHVPGVTQESLVRMIGHAIGPRSLHAGGAALNELDRINPDAGEYGRSALMGGQQAGMTLAGRTHLVSDNFRGTPIEPLLKGMEALFKAPGAKQVATAWRGWSNFILHTTKTAIEQNVAKGYIGKQLLREHGYAEAAKVDGFMGVLKRTMGLHGQILHDAAHGMVDEKKILKLRTEMDQMGGKWTDLSPAGQKALMYTPFGLWWWNSAKFIARMPIDMPVKTGALAAANLGTLNARKKEGLAPGFPGALPNYMQGGLGLGNGDVLAQNYYMPWGMLNDPYQTGASLMIPWLQPVLEAAQGNNWLGKPLTSPGDPHGNRGASGEQIAQEILGSFAASFVPFYTKMEQIASGGASRFDVSNSGWLPTFAPTKEKGSGLLGGLQQAFKPYREYHAHSKSSGGGGPNIPGSIGTVGGSTGSLGGSTGTIPGSTATIK